MSFSYLDHTGDVGIELEALSLESLLADAALAFVDIVTEPDRIARRSTARLTASGDDAAELLLHWLEELLFLFDTRDVLGHVARLEVTRGPDAALHLDAELEGEALDLERHPVKVQIKAITYHDLAVERRDDRWHGRVIFDI